MYFVFIHLFVFIYETNLQLIFDIKNSSKWLRKSLLIKYTTVICWKFFYKYVCEINS